MQTAIFKSIDRYTLIDQALSARTTEELQEAQRLIESWMREHPDDFGVLDGGEQVAISIDATR